MIIFIKKVLIVQQIYYYVFSFSFEICLSFQLNNHVNKSDGKRLETFLLHGSIEQYSQLFIKKKCILLKPQCSIDLDRKQHRSNSQILILLIYFNQVFNIFLHWLQVFQNNNTLFLIFFSICKPVNICERLDIFGMNYDCPI